MTHHRPRPTQVKPLPRFRLWLRYCDGVEGEVDLSDLAGRGVFAAWNHPEAFDGVRLGEHGRIQWDDDLELCPDAMYLRLTGKYAEELFPNLREAHVRA